MKLEELSNNSRVWVYQSNRMLSTEEVNYIEKSAEEFIKDWATHGTKLRAAVKVVNNLFVILAADEEQVKASGCSIDSSVRWIKQIGEVLNVDFFDRLLIAIKRKDTNKLELIPFGKLDNEAIDENDRVYNTLIKNLGEFNNSFEIPVKNSWIYDRMT